MTDATPSPGPTPEPRPDAIPSPERTPEPPPGPDPAPRPGATPSPETGPAPPPGATPSPETGPGPGARPERDPGLQPERTRLAWRRTTLSSTVAAVLAVKACLHRGPTAAGIAACVLCCALWLAFLLLAHHRVRALDAPRPRALAPRHATAAVLCTLALALCATALVV